MPFDGTGLRYPALTEMLVNGREAILTRGWIQHYERSPRGVCLLGSLIGTYSAIEEAKALLLAAIKDLGFGAFSSIPQFNDEPGRTREEVLAVNGRAIEMSVA